MAYEKDNTMKTIWKWTLQPETTIDMPHGAKLLAVQEQHGEPQLWALVDPGATKYPRTFHAHRTGHDLPDEPGQYVGTFQMHGGSLGFHVFEVNTEGNDPMRRTLATIGVATDGATERCGLDEAVAVLISQRNNARNIADSLRAKLKELGHEFA